MKKQVVFLGMVLTAALVSGMSTMVYAQSPAEDFARQQAEQQKKQQIDMMRTFTPNEIAEPADPVSQFQPQDGTCFDIDRVVVEGNGSVSPKELRKIADSYAGKCIGLADIQNVLHDVTKVYLDAGYVSTRVYIPAQDIKASRQFRMTVVEGRLSDIYYNGKAAGSAAGIIAGAFTGLKGNVLNMRDIEQGLDQMNRLASNNARSELLPGREEGSTILNVTNAPDKRWRISVSHDNLGQVSTGYARYNMGLMLDDVLKVNDLWNFNYQHTDRDYWHDNDLDGASNSYSGSVSIPYGYWTYTVSGYYYEYHSIVPGNFGPIRTSGDSSELSGSASRIIHRDSYSISTVNLGLAYKETNNFLLGNRIEVGSRRYTVGTLGISHSRRMLAGTWTFDLTYTQGLSLFGAVKKHEPAAGNADPQFSKLGATVSVMTPFKIAGQNFLLSNLLVGQYAADNLLGAEQISLGSYSNVRGSRESLLYANNGFFMRNELVWRTVPWSRHALLAGAFGEFRPYAGLDYGRVFSQSAYGMTGGDLASWTVGARLAGGRISFDAGYSDVFASTVKDRNTGLAFFNIAINF